jgi:hypothetical protein
MVFRMNGGSMATLKWDGDELKLGATKMAEVMPVWSAPGAPQTETFKYVIGPSDFVSEPYQDKDDARQDCFNAVHALLKKAGA